MTSLKPLVNNLEGRLSTAFLFNVLYKVETLTNSNDRYSQFNALHVTGRIYHAEVVEYNGSRFLSASVISTASKNGVDIVYKFTDSQGLMNLFEKGYFGKGRQVTITGHIVNVSEVYTDKKTGEVVVRKNPEITLQGVIVLDGGLGPAPMDKSAAKRPAAGTVVHRQTAPSKAYGENNPMIDGVPAF